jgi:hypothetical protein
VYIEKEVIREIEIPIIREVIVEKEVLRYIEIDR